MKNFISTLDFDKSELTQMLDFARDLKAADGSEEFKGKVLTALFYNPSLRTLLSFQTGMQKLGGIANIMDMSSSRQLAYKHGAVMDGAESEHIKEFIQVVCSYSDVIAVRKSDFIPNSKNELAGDALAMSKEEMLSDGFFEQIQEYATVPVINMESNMFHPCQSLADMLTMQELLGDVQGKKYVLTWAPHPKPLPLATPHSQLATPSIFGMDVTLACPPEFKFSDEMMAKMGDVKVVRDQAEAMEGAEIVCAKSWLSLEHFGNWDAEMACREKYKDWQVDSAKLGDAKFMHCLPVRRNVVVADEVLDSDNSVVIQEAENRMWAQMGLIKYLLNQ